MSDDRIYLQKSELEIRVACTTHRYSFDDMYLSWTWEGCFASGSRKTELWRLSAEPSRVERREPLSREFKMGIWMVVAAVVVFQSELRWMIPLLAPLLAVVGIFKVLVGALELRKFKAMVYYSSSEEAVSFPLNGDVDGDYDEFIAGLNEQIKKARVHAYRDSAI